MTPAQFEIGRPPQAPSEGDALEWLRAADIEWVHLGLFDASGVLRQKRLSAGAAARAVARGWSFIDAIQWWGPRDELRRAGGSEHQAVVLDAGSGRRYPFEDRAALFLAEFEGPLAELSPRHQLDRMIDRAAALGLEADLGWEFECIVLEGDPVADGTGWR